jgi:hypothetical protein
MIEIEDDGDYNGAVGFVEYLSICPVDTGPPDITVIPVVPVYPSHPTVALLAFISDFEDFDDCVLQQADVVVDQHSLVNSAALAH